MASQIYNAYKEQLGQGGVDWRQAGDDIRIALLMTNTTAGTENDAIKFVSQFTTLDEFDGTGYTPGFGNRILLANRAVSNPDPNDRADLTADNITGLTLGDGTRQIAGMLIYKNFTSDAASHVIAWIDDGGFPVDGSNLSGVTWAAGGIIQIGA